MARPATAWWPGGRAATKATPEPPGGERVDGDQAGSGGQAGRVPRRCGGIGVGIERPAAVGAEAAEPIEVRRVVHPGQLVDPGGSGRDPRQVALQMEIVDAQS